MVPSIGRIVHYRLAEHDIKAINDKRALRRERNALFGANQVIVGEVYPAMIVRVFGITEEAYCNLKVFMDGDDCFWATSRREGDGEGEFQWPQISRP